MVESEFGLDLIAKQLFSSTDDEPSAVSEVSKFKESSSDRESVIPLPLLVSSLLALLMMILMLDSSFAIEFAILDKLGGRFLLEELTGTGNRGMLYL